MDNTPNTIADEQENAVLAQWQEIKTLVEMLELDMLKNARGTVAAGVRVRKGLRDLRGRVASLVKLTVEADKAQRAAKAAGRASKTEQS